MIHALQIGLTVYPAGKLHSGLQAHCLTLLTAEVEPVSAAEVEVEVALLLFAEKYQSLSASLAVQQVLWTAVVLPVELATVQQVILQQFHHDHFDPTTAV